RQFTRQRDRLAGQGRDRHRRLGRLGGLLVAAACGKGERERCDEGKGTVVAIRGHGGGLGWGRKERTPSRRTSARSGGGAGRTSSSRVRYIHECMFVKGAGPDPLEHVMARKTREDALETREGILDAA